jgi:hypothetical protein
MEVPTPSLIKVLILLRLMHWSGSGIGAIGAIGASGKVCSAAIGAIKQVQSVHYSWILSDLLCYTYDYFLSEICDVCGEDIHITRNTLMIHILCISEE